MNKTELAAHVADQLSLTKTAADQMVSAVFCAIANSLAQNETVTIAASTAPSFKAGTP